MHTLRLVLTPLGGFWLYYIAVVMYGGIAAAWPVSLEYFQFFGRRNLHLALALESLARWALPVAVLICGGSLALLRLLPGAVHRDWLLVLLGMIAGYLFFAFPPASLGQHVHGRDLTLSEQIDWINPRLTWWVAHNFLAPWLGLLAATWLLRRKGKPIAPTASDA